MSGNGKAKVSPVQRTLGSDGDDWRLGKKPATPKSRGTTMTLRKSHTADLERSPTVFPTAKMSTFKDAPSAEKRKILDEGDRRSQEERAKLDKRTPSRVDRVVVAPRPTTSRKRSTRRLWHTMARSALTRRRSVAAHALHARWLSPRRPRS